MSKKLLILSFSLSTLFILSPFTIHAATPSLTPYKLLEPLPGIETTQGSGVTNAGAYLGGIFQLALALAGVLAVIRIIYGGTVYMTTDAFGKKGEAKKVIQNALLGLLLAAGSWLILALVLSPNCQNGQAFCFNLSLGQPIFSTQTNTNTPGTGPGPGASGLTQADVMQMFQSSGIQVAGAIQLAGLQLNTISELATLKQQCGCTVMVTSATGGAHESGTYSHANGYKVDLRSVNEGGDLTSYIMSHYTSLPDRSDGARMYESPSHNMYALEKNPPHWDVTVK